MASIFANFTPNEEEILGATCIILWGLTAIVMVKYCVFIFFLDDNGEGGGCISESYFGFYHDLQAISASLRPALAYGTCKWLVP